MHEGIIQEMILVKQGVQKSQLISKNHLLQAQEQFITMYKNHAKVAGVLHEWTKQVYKRWKQSQVTKMNIEIRYKDGIQSVKT